MALVLRKAVMPKNVSLLKCIKGRSLASTANKKSPATLCKMLYCIFHHCFIELVLYFIWLTTYLLYVGTACSLGSIVEYIVATKSLYFLHKIYIFRYHL